MKMRLMILSCLSIISILALSLYFITIKETTFKCVANVTSIKQTSGDSLITLMTNSHLILRHNGTGIVAHKGELQHAEMTYLINRKVNFTYHSIDNDGTYSFTEDSVVKFPTDNVPHESSRYFVSLGDNDKPISYDFTLTKISHDEVILYSYGKPMLMCKTY